MAIALGTDNKRQVQLAVALGIAIVAIAGWEIYGLMGKSSSPSPALKPIANPTLHALAAPAAPAKKSTHSRLDPVLRIDQLSRSETVEYSGTGRDVFSPVAEPVVIESNQASGRAEDLAATPPPPVEPPKPPAMDLKYLGYTQTTDKTLTALFTHGDDIFMAKTGDIMFHRFRVGVILPASVQVTDLTHNNTQNIAVAAATN
jgi:hypothetical protein